MRIHKNPRLLDARIYLIQLFRRSWLDVGTMIAYNAGGVIQQMKINSSSLTDATSVSSSPL